MTGFGFGGQSRANDAWTVSEITAYVQELFDIDYRLQDISVRGEISNFTQARSGHLYFTLKDESAQLKCVMWRSAAVSLPLMPKEGDAIVASGRVGVYEKQGIYQLYVDRIVQSGRGDLAQAFEELKRRLEYEGLFSPEHKRSIPPFPNKIGVVTSADAAALRDILHVLKRRSPNVSVLVCPTLVQGQEAPPQIVRALKWLDGRDDIDIIILARGGGSIEDLWAFNDEGVARAIFEARHPIISGVGHETDFTIADFVADVRAPTPSAAAEICVPDIADMQGALDAVQERLRIAVERSVEDGRARVAGLERNLRHLGPLVRINNVRQSVDGMWNRLDNAMLRRLERIGSRLEMARTRLEAVSPQATLQRGYAIVQTPEGDVIRRVTQVDATDRLHVRVSDGQFSVKVIEESRAA